MADIKLHPGAEIALKRAEMDESEVARAIASGELTSPQKYNNGYLFNLRITGTGLAYRSALKEHVWRDPSLYLNQNFIDRCQGLPVIIEHPKTMMLDGKEFLNRIIGMIVYPYLKPEDKEVWGIARILDPSAARYMREHQLSTSPAVVFRNQTMNDREQLTNGKHLLIEGKPSLIDHLAICEEGVWDKGGPPTGVDLSGKGVSMTEEETKAKEEAERKEREDKARRDADPGEKLDKLLTGLDSLRDDMSSMKGRMDAIEADKRDDGDDTDAATEERQAAELHRLAEEEEEEAAEAEEATEDDSRHDAAKKRFDAAKKRFDRAHKRLDAAHKRLDDDGRMRHDAARKRFDDAGSCLEDAMKKHRDDGEEEEMPAEVDRKAGEADSAYSQRMDDLAKRHDSASRLMKRDDESIAAHCDRVARDTRRDRARRDAEEAVEKTKEEAEAARADAAAARAESAETRRLLEEMRGTMNDRPDAEEAHFADAQARADTVYMALGDHAPRAMRGETLIGYRARLARGIQKHSGAWKDEDLAKLARHSPSAFEAAEMAVYADAQTASRQPLALEGGSALRKIIRHREGGGEIYEWAGDPLSWMSDFMPGQTFATRIGSQNNN